MNNFNGQFNLDGELEETQGSLFFFCLQKNEKIYIEKGRLGGRREAETGLREEGPGTRRPGTHPHFPAVCVYYDFNVKSDQYGRGCKISASLGAFRELRTTLAAGLLTYRNTGCVLSARSISAK